MRGLGLRVGSSALNYRALRVLGMRVPRWTGGRLPWLGLSEYTLGELPGPDWVRLRPLLSGICGSDLSLLTGRSSAVLSPFNSFPAILGHEVVAAVEEAGAVAGVAVGQRVVLDPIISCAVRGLDPCPGCTAGTPALCRRASEGALAPGMLIGFCRDLPGAWSEGMLAHASQLHAVPAQLSDETAALAEPLACGLHAVLAQAPAEGERALVIGGGAIGLGTLAALRMVAPGTETTIVVRHPLQAELARQFGAHQARLYLFGSGPEEDALKDLARKLGVEDRVNFVGWVDSSSRIWPEIDLLLFPSRHEGSPNAVLEAFAHGVPVLASDTPEHREILDPASLLPPEDEWAWSEKLKKILTATSDSLMSLHGQQQRCAEKLRFDWDAEILRKILEHTA